MTRTNSWAEGPSLEDLARQIVALLPEDGTPVLNRVMRVLLSRELEARIGPELYFEACDLLAQRRTIGRLRGQSGQIFRSVKGLPQTEPAPVVAAAWPEAQLMRPVHTYLEGPFRAGLDLPPDGIGIVLDTSVIGPPKGRWARPDFILVTAMRFKLLPGAQVDVHSFELKTETGASVVAVHEALAQTRFTHFGHLIWHLPERSKMETRLSEIKEHCDDHGVGLIRVRDPLDIAGYEILVDPIRKPTLSAAIEGFLDTRFTQEQRQRLASAVRG